jgi:hypothetical protein
MLSYVISHKQVHCLLFQCIMHIVLSTDKLWCGYYYTAALSRIPFYLHTLIKRYVDAKVVLLLYY